MLPGMGGEKDQPDNRNTIQFISNNLEILVIFGGF